MWLAGARVEKLSRAAAAAIEEFDLVVSPVVLLELAYLHEVGRLVKPPFALFNQLESQIGLKRSDCSLAALMGTAVFESWTWDPFDRMIVAHARADRMSTLVTSDEKLRRNYANSIW